MSESVGSSAAVRDLASIMAESNEINFILYPDGAFWDGGFSSGPLLRANADGVEAYRLLSALEAGELGIIVDKSNHQFRVSKTHSVMHPISIRHLGQG